MKTTGKIIHMKGYIDDEDHGENETHVGYIDDEDHRRYDTHEGIQ